MGLIDIQFVNDSAPYLSADNLNHMITEHNYTHNATVRNSSRIDNLTQEVDDIKNNIIPEEVVKEAVDDYVGEHSGGFATETELQSLNESLMNLEYDENGGKNLLECTLSTTTKNGITCERLSDGTYKLNGTLNGANAYFDIGSASVEIGKHYKHFGFSNPNKSTIASYIQNSDGTHTHWETDNDGIITAQSSNYNMVIRVNGNGTVCNNLIFKPMISEDTSITFSDYVPYIKSVRGLTESLTNLISTFTKMGICKKVEFEVFADGGGFSIRIYYNTENNGYFNIWFNANNNKLSIQDFFNGQLVKNVGVQLS